MEFRLLGPVEVRVGGVAVDAGQPRQRTVLAALLVDAGRPVPPETLIDRVWGDAPPRTARRSLHAHLTRIRRLLEHHGTPPAPLVLRPDGYVLDVDPDAVDLHRFRRMVSDPPGTDRTAEDRVRRLRAALRLWRGEPLAGLPGDWAARTRLAWSQQRVDGVIAWAGAELDVGNGEATIGPLTELAADHPFLEPLAAALLRALHSAGRSTTAIEHYAAVRTLLRDELGVEPGAELRAAHLAILRGEPHEASRRRAHRTLPADVVGFVGRGAELRQLLDAVDTTVAAGVRAVAIHAVDGMAGVGKTAFAVHAAHHLADRFPDGQQFVDLRAHAPGRTVVDAAAALEILLRADGVAAQQIPAELEARAGLWRDRMADRRMLLVFDDAADAAHVAPLLPAAPGCLVLVTSRRKLALLPGAVPLSLGTLPPADAARLFLSRAGSVAAPVSDRDRAAVERITQLCGYLPLAIALTAARLHIHRAWTITDLAEELDQARDRLSELTSGDLAVAAAFDLSYRDLPADRQRLFRRLSLHPGPALDAHAAAALDGTSLAAARRGLEALLEHNLLIEPRRGRYRFHDLIAEHARAHAANDPEPDRDAALDRLLGYYGHTATVAATRQQPGFEPIDTGPPPADTPTIADAQQATDWFTAEQPNLAAVTAHAATRHHPAAIAISAAVHEHLRNRGPFDLAIRMHDAALATARHTDNRPAQARILVDIAQIQQLINDYPASVAAAEQAHAIFERLDDRRGQARAQDTLARVLFATDDFPREMAVSAAERAHALHRELGDRRGQAAALEILARVRHLAGDFAAAIVAAEEASAIFDELDDRPGQATALSTLARLRGATGDYPASAAAAEHSLVLHRSLGNRPSQASVLGILALVRHATGDDAAAAEAIEQALHLYRELVIRHGQADALHTLAVVRHATGDHAAAAAAAEEALALCQELGARLGEANVMQVLALVRHTAGDSAAAAALLDRALDGFREVGEPDGEAETLNHLGQVQLDSGSPADADKHFSAALDIARRIGAPAHEARALEGIGHCRPDPDEGARYLRDALAIYRKLHSPHAARVEAALNSDR